MTEHLSADEFRKRGYELIDWIADYLDDRVSDLPVASKVEPGWVRDQLPPSPPEHGEPWADVMADIDRVVVPGLTHWQSPNFYAFFPGNNSGPAILGELLSAGVGVQGMLWATSPACTEIETHMCDWLVELLDLPDRFLSSGAGGGVLQDSASSSSLVAMLAARDRHGSGREVAYVSPQTHSSLEKGVGVARIPHLRSIDVDDEYAMRPEALATAIADDRAAGLDPTFVCATVGTTSSMAIDPVRAIGEICRDEGAWLHVDAAMAGTAGVCPEFRSMLDGLELGDSYVFNPHKWMLTNFDCSALFVADRSAILDSLSILPDYLRNTASEAGAVIDYRDWQVPLGRRFKALKLWFVIRHYGGEGLRAHVRAHVALAVDLAARVEADDRFELAAPQRLGLVCFRCVDGDAATDALLAAVNDSSRAYLTGTKLADRSVIRVSIGSTKTAREHVDQLWSLIDDLA